MEKSVDKRFKKFDKTDEVFFKNHDELMIRYNPSAKEVLDQFGLFGGWVHMGRMLFIYELVKKAIKVPGHIAEFGCWNGANLSFLAKTLKILEPHSQRLVYGFDSFCGLTEFDERDGDAVDLKDQYAGSKQRLLDFLKMYELEDSVELVEGIIEETLPRFMQENQAAMFSLVYCDTDLHASTKKILYTLHDRIMPTGIIAFDEWNYEQFPGETIAFREFLKEYSKYYDVLEMDWFTRQPSCGLIRNKYSGV